MNPVTELSADDARRLILRAQGFLGADSRRGGVPALLPRLRAVQLDTISVLARSHELVAYARLGAVPRAAVEHAYWDEPARAFEYWAHAACILPVEDWPYYSFRRRAFKASKRRWHRVPETVDAVLDKVRADGPLTTGDLGGAKAGGEWWDWSDSKIAIEWLLDIGEVVCTRRVGWRRVYDLAERALPADVREAEPSDEECVRYLTRRAGQALGVATRADLVDFVRLRKEHAVMLDAALADGSAGLMPVRVEGWGSRAGHGPNAWADPEALATEPRGRVRTTLLSPFDSLIWERKRTERLFGLSHRLEAYVPAPKRVHGYFAMPVLAGGRLVARVDPAREGRTLVAKRVTFESAARAAVESTARALWEAASWVSCDDVRVEVTNPPDLADSLRAALAATTP
ncbi:winged helix-turn-helix domain-containing protein [Bailinhaonella thermotolerans]|uniref:winged helix-turn-helix domain-containing protein n=1 Tax=Bailinhaonella thermotolerans TaxID=1070861 RepID=UPI00192A3F25|nr:crosslink repair DNA glycosylase YcaQ family protein [Bailinhaonella thermotolerans]